MNDPSWVMMSDHLDQLRFLDRGMSVMKMKFI